MGAAYYFLSDSAVGLVIVDTKTGNSVNATTVLRKLRGTETMLADISFKVVLEDHTVDYIDLKCGQNLSNGV